MLGQLDGGDRMAVPSQKTLQLIRWAKLRRLAFRFDGRTKVICLAGFVVPGLLAVDKPVFLYGAGLFGLIVLAFVPVLIGKSVAKEIERRFGSEVLQRALHHCTLGRYMRNKSFTIGDIQAELAAQHQSEGRTASND